MLLVDDLLLAPFKGLFWIFREIHKTAQREEEAEAENITFELSELYMKLETGAITEEQFEAQEKVLLDRLDAIQDRAAERAGSEDANEETGGAEGDSI